MTPGIPDIEHEGSAVLNPERGMRGRHVQRFQCTSRPSQSQIEKADRGTLNRQGAAVRADGGDEEVRTEMRFIAVREGEYVAGPGVLLPTSRIR